MLFKKNKPKGKDKEKSETKKENPYVKDNLEIFPIRNYDEKLDGFVYEDKSYYDILEIIPRDRGNEQKEELSYDIFALARFLRLYYPDCKFMGLNFPINTRKQRQYLQYAIENTLDPIRKMWLEREIKELEVLETTVTRREYYLVFYGENKKDFMKNKTNILRWVGQGRSKFVKEISKDKKIQIVRKLCNMNTLIIPDFLNTKGDIDEED
ncbi:MAG: hypothetical protein SOR72_04380 [Hornefia sp.]|nr:hypothetical protein [Hornefia sp.]